MVGYICPTHTVSVTYKLGVTAAGMIGHAPSPRPTEGKRPIAAVDETEFRRSQPGCFGFSLQGNTTESGIFPTLRVAGGDAAPRARE
jgi:hypothetical protein